MKHVILFKFRHIFCVTLSLMLVACGSGGGGEDDNSALIIEALFSDDFEEPDCLGKWTVGGRQLEGTNIANCVIRNGSTVGHLFKFSFTEINLVPADGPFTFSNDLIFDFDMEVRVSSSGGAPSNYYGKSAVFFNFRNSEDALLGSVSYIAATTQYPFDSVAADPTRATVQVAENVSTHYSLSAAEILSHIDIDSTEIASVEIMFNTYSSTRPNPYVEAELWIDNVRVGL